MPFTVPQPYVPEFHHDDWIDNQDVVEAGGEKGFNRKFHSLEDEFALIKESLDQLNTAAQELQTAMTSIQTQLAGTLTVNNVTATGNIGIGVAASAAAPLQVAVRALIGPFPSRSDAAVGRLEVSGSNAEFSFVRRTMVAAVATMAAGDRFVWYNPDGSARLWTEVRGDLLTLLSNGNLGIGTNTPGHVLDVSGRMRVRQEGTDTAGIWLSGYGVVDKAFIGMKDPSNVGFWGNTGTPNWRLSVDTGTGDLTIAGTNAFKTGGGSWAVPSDLRLKKNVSPLEGAMEKLRNLRPVTFEWERPEDQGNLTGTQVGLIAQEVEEHFPDWVCVHPSGYKALVFRGFEALTIQALRELKEDNDLLRTQLAELQGRPTTADTIIGRD